MKKMIKTLFVSSVATSFALAGGHIKDPAPVLEPVVEPVVAIPAAPVVCEPTPIPVYIGIGYGYLDQTADSISTMNGADGEWSVNTVLFQLGVDLHEYLAVEGRYWLGVTDASQTLTGTPDMDLSGDYNAWGIYLKPRYAIDETFTVYGLIGYAGTNLEPDNHPYWKTDNVSYGIGAKVNVMENLSIFADYTILGITDEFDNVANGMTSTEQADIYISTINVGVSYHF